MTFDFRVLAHLTNTEVGYKHRFSYGDSVGLTVEGSEVLLFWTYHQRKGYRSKEKVVGSPIAFDSVEAAWESLVTAGFVGENEIDGFGTIEGDTVTPVPRTWESLVGLVSKHRLDRDTIKARFREALSLFGLPTEVPILWCPVKAGQDSLWNKGVDDLNRVLRKERTADYRKAAEKHLRTRALGRWASLYGRYPDPVRTQRTFSHVLVGSVYTEVEGLPPNGYNALREVYDLGYSVDLSDPNTPRLLYPFPGGKPPTERLNRIAPNKVLA